MQKQLNKNLAEIQQEILEVIQNSPMRDKIKSVAIFGSYAKNQQTENSDIDILINLTEPVGFDFIRLEYSLTDKLGVKIDLVAENAISPYLKDEILKSKKIIYER